MSWRNFLVQTDLVFWKAFAVILIIFHSARTFLYISMENVKAFKSTFVSYYINIICISYRYISLISVYFQKWAWGISGFFSLYINARFVLFVHILIGWLEVFSHKNNVGNPSNLFVHLWASLNIVGNFLILFGHSIRVWSKSAQKLCIIFAFS